MPVIVIESRHLHTPDEKGGGPGGARGGGGTSPKEEDVHEVHPVLRQRLTPKDKCWQTEAYTVVEECDRCTGESERVGQGRREARRDSWLILMEQMCFLGTLVCLHKSNFKKKLGFEEHMNT